MVPRTLAILKLMKIEVIVKPGSKKGPAVEVVENGSLKVYVREVAADGKANEAVIKLLAKHYGTAKSNVQILRGHTSRTTLIQIL